MLRFRFAAAAFLAVAAPAALAEDINVNSTADLPDADPQDGVCDADLGREGLQSTLRAAVMHANVTPGLDRILVPAGRYRLTRKGAGEDEGATGDLDVTDDLEISGSDATEVVIDGAKAKDRVLHLVAGRLELYRVTLRGGNAGEEGGGGLLVSSSLGSAIGNCIVTKNRSGDDGAGVAWEAGEHAMADCTISFNKSADDSGGVEMSPGTSAQIGRCAIVRNSAKDQGGAIEISGASLQIGDSTISGNRAVEGGGGINVENGGQVSILHVTIAFNRSVTGAGGVHSDFAGIQSDIHSTNSIFHRNQRINSNLTLSSGGGNLDSGTSCEFGQGDLSFTDARLLPLARSKTPGGPAHFLRSDSPARGFASSGCSGVDQTGNGRGEPCDSGAVRFAD